MAFTGWSGAASWPPMATSHGSASTVRRGSDGRSIPSMARRPSRPTRRATPLLDPLLSTAPTPPDPFRTGRRLEWNWTARGSLGAPGTPTLRVSRRGRGDMSTDVAALFCDTNLARCIDGAEVDLIGAVIDA